MVWEICRNQQKQAVFSRKPVESLRGRTEKILQSYQRNLGLEQLTKLGQFLFPMENRKEPGRRMQVAYLLWTMRELEPGILVRELKAMERQQEELPWEAICLE